MMLEYTEDLNKEKNKRDIGFMREKSIKQKENMSIVIVGHVDHGKSTIIGRLLADTGSLPEGKLEQVKESCRRNSKPFEYAFLLDALKEEQKQGITIDSARCFFKTWSYRVLEKYDYRGSQGRSSITCHRRKRRCAGKF